MTVDKQGLEAAMNAPLDEKVEHPRIWLEPAGAPDRCWCSDNQWGDEGVEYVLAASPSPSEMDVVAEAIYNADFRVGTWAEWAEIDEEEPANKRLKDQYRAYATAALSGAQSALAAMRAERDEAIERGYEWFNLAQDYKANVPYAGATSGTAARDEITKILRRFGCSNVGYMDDYERHEVLLAFEHRGNRVQLRASAQGWANMYLKANPWTPRRSLRKEAYERAALDRGLIAINSVLRDWVKGQVTAVECGVLSFAGVFLPYMLAADGKPLIEHIAASNLLPAPTEQQP